VLHHLDDDLVGQAKGDSLVDRPGLQPVPEGVRMRPETKRGRVKIHPAVRATALDPDVLRNRLPAPAPGEDEVDDRLLDRLLRVRHEGHAVPRTSLPGFHNDDPSAVRTASSRT